MFTRKRGGEGNVSSIRYLCSPVPAAKKKREKATERDQSAGAVHVEDGEAARDGGERAHEVVGVPGRQGRQARLAELAHDEPPPGADHTAQFAEGRRGVGGVPETEGHAGGIEGTVGLKPADVLADLLGIAVGLLLAALLAWLSRPRSPA